MTWFKRQRESRKPGPVPMEILAAHREAKAAKHEASHAAPRFQELAQNMIMRHQRNGFGDKLEATYARRGIL